MNTFFCTQGVLNLAWHPLYALVAYCIVEFFAVAWQLLCLITIIVYLVMVVLRQLYLAFF